MKIEKNRNSSKSVKMVFDLVANGEVFVYCSNYFVKSYNEDKNSYNATNLHNGYQEHFDLDTEVTLKNAKLVME